jgi:hypothetical protein
LNQPIDPGERYNRAIYPPQGLKKIWILMPLCEIATLMALNEKEKDGGDTGR